MPVGFQVELDRLARDFQQAADKFPERRRQMLERIGAELGDAVRKNVPTESSRDRFRRPPGTIRAGQETKLGSGGGYVAIRPAKGDAPQRVGRRRDRYGTITQALEDGHHVKLVRGGSKFVSGRLFYRTARKSADQIAQKHLDALKREIEEELIR